MTKRSAQQIRALRTSLSMNQEQFGKRLGVGQSAISAWEAGKTPSKDIFIVLGNVARYPESLWFWEQGGVRPEAMLSTAGELLKKRGVVPTSGEIVRVLPTSGKAGVDPLPMPAELIDAPLSTNYLIVDDTLATEMFARGDVLLVDTSQNGEILEPLKNKIVLVEFGPRAERRPGGWEEIWPEGLFIGRLTITNRSNLPSGSIWFAAYIGNFMVGLWQYPVPPENRMGQGLDEGKPKDWGEAIRDAEALAPRHVRLKTGCRLIGRMVAWFSSAGEKK